MTKSLNRKIAIVGAGLTGLILGVFLARRGHAIELFERRPDPRPNQHKRGHSINITLCTRGFLALDALSIGQFIRKITVPVYGRVIHFDDGETEYQPYGNKGEALYSVSRRELYLAIVELGASEPSVTIRFNERCVGVDFETMTLSIENTVTGVRRRKKVDHLFGADGAHSYVREQLRDLVRFDIVKKTAAYANKEIIISQRAAASLFHRQNALHIWPRGDYMLIAFPNRDGSFTCTLNLPYRGKYSFETLRTALDLEQFFADAFSDLLGAIPDYKQQFFENRMIRMVSVQCEQWSLGHNTLLIGDAAHALWPSYGQGANAAFEDCLVLDQCLEYHGENWEAAFTQFEALRKPNADAILRLSEDHFYELREHIGDPRFLLRKQIERKLSQIAPELFTPLYNLISFTSMPYLDALQIASSQRWIVDFLLDMEDISTRLDTLEVEQKIITLLGEMERKNYHAGRA